MATGQTEYTQRSLQPRSRWVERYIGMRRALAKNPNMALGFGILVIISFFTVFAGSGRPVRSTGAQPSRQVDGAWCQALVWDRYDGHGTSTRARSTAGASRCWWDSALPC